MGRRSKARMKNDARVGGHCHAHIRAAVSAPAALTFCGCGSAGGSRLCPNICLRAVFADEDGAAGAAGEELAAAAAAAAGAVWPAAAEPGGVRWLRGAVARGGVCEIDAGVAAVMAVAGERNGDCDVDAAAVAAVAACLIGVRWLVVVAAAADVAVAGDAAACMSSRPSTSQSNGVQWSYGHECVCHAVCWQPTVIKISLRSLFAGPVAAALAATAALGGYRTNPV